MKRDEEKIEITLKSGGKFTFSKGVLLSEILENLDKENKQKIVLARIDSHILNLNHRLEKGGKIYWIPLNTPEGTRSYRYTLCLILITAMKQILPEERVIINHSIGKGLYCEFKTKRKATSSIIKETEKRMQKIISMNERIVPVTLKTDEAIKQFEKDEKRPNLILPENKPDYITFYKLRENLEYFCYPLLPSTGFIESFALRLYKPGFILRFPYEERPELLAPFIKQKKLSRVFHEYHRWESILGLEKLSDINHSIIEGKLAELIKIGEALHEKKIVFIADRITKIKKRCRIILISGPSSSGKTTFTKRLLIQLKVNHIRPLSISMDDYFFDRDMIPLDRDGKQDFESLSAVDTERLKHDLYKLLRGESVNIPHFDFKTGKRVDGQPCLLEPDQPILIEGIHALNDTIVDLIPVHRVLKIYVSALTQLNITDHIRVHTSDVRLFRRLIRDNRFRGYLPEHILKLWPEVRRGEEKYIFPYQEKSDIIFNSSLSYELCILKSLALPLLETIEENHESYPEALRLKELLQHILPGPPAIVPPNSILREFIGESSFEY